MMTSNIPSPPGSTQTYTATSLNQSSSFSNQPLSRYPIPPNLLPYNPFLPYFLSVQQPVIPPSYPQAYDHSLYPYALQQWNDPICAHAPSDFSFPLHPNSVHFDQQYSVLPSHTNTPILHQNPSLSYDQHPSHSQSSGTPHPYDHKLSSQPFPLYSSTDPNSVTTAASTATSQHSINSPDVHSLTSQFSSMTTLTKKTLKPERSHSTRHLSNVPYHTEQSSYQQSFPHHRHRQSYTFNRDSTITAHYSLALPSSPATTPSSVTVSPSIPAHQHPLSPAMQHYVTYLKNVYKKIKTPVYDKEHSLLQVKAKSFINIALVHKDSPQYMNDSVRNEMIMDRLHGHVDAIQETKTKLFICDICKSQDGKLACSVLVEGAPGVGKTTFSCELCKRWAKGEILWEWAAVILIKLRDYRTRTAQNMYDLLYHPRPEVRKAVVDELIDHDGECILLILDGYDELTDSQRESTYVIQQIMDGELLVQSTVMVTSRPLATRTLHYNFVQSIDQHIEVLGFTENNIEEYIQSACGDKPKLVDDFKSYLSFHPFSSALMFNPLQCAIVTDLYRTHWERGDKGFAPKTLTELYTGLVHIMLLRYLSQHPVYKDGYWRIKDLRDLPEEVSQQLKAVTKLASEGIKKREYVFDEVNTNIPPETLGLMQKEEVVASGIGISTSHNFLHLTLQEYLAAVNYSQQYSSPEQLSQLLTQFDLFPLDFFLQYYGMKREPTLYLSATHWPVILFVAGRTKLNGVSTDIFKTGLYDSDDDDEITTVNISLLHLLYETQSPQLIKSTLVTSRKYLSVISTSALDSFVIGYCITNSTSTWKVKKSSYDFDQLVVGLRLGPEECSESKIISLHISGHWTGNIKNLLNLKPYGKSITEIELVGNKPWEQCDLEKSTRSLVSTEMSACYPMLKRFTIDSLEISYSASLLSFITQHSDLQILSLNQCNLNSIATSSLIHFLQSPNNRLHKLRLDNCTIQIPDHTNSIPISYEIKLVSSSNFSCEITSSLYAINYILSQPDQIYTKTLTILKVTIVREVTDSLQTVLYSKLVILEIISNSTIYLHSFPFSSQENNLHTLLLRRCHLSNECVSSLTCFLQSPNNKLTLNECTIQIPDHTKSAAISCYNISPTDTGNFSLEITGSLYAINYMLSLPNQFYANMLSNLNVTIVSGSTDSLQTSLYSNLVTLAIVSKCEENIQSIPFSSHENNLRTLTFTRCHLSNKCVGLLTCFLQSPNNSLCKLTLDDCTIQIPDYIIPDHSAAISCHLELISPSDTGNFCLEITGSLYAVNYILSQPDLFYANTLIILKVIIVSGTKDLLQIDTSLYLNLKMLDITSEEENYTLLHVSVLFSSQRNNLSVLSMKKCNLTCDTVRSLIHSLQSSHCGLQELTLYDCVSDHNYTTTTSSKLKLMSLGSGNVSLSCTGCFCDISYWLSQLSFYTQLTEFILHLNRQDLTTAYTLQKIQLYHHVLESLKIVVGETPQQNIVSIKTNNYISLVTIDYLCVLDHILSNVIFTQMTELSLCITAHISSEAEVLTKIPVSCPVLETIKIDSGASLSLPLSIPQFIGSQQNNLHTLSLRRCTLSSDVTRSLIHSLQSPHCKLYKLALYDCTIPTTDHTQLTTAIFSSTTITHLLFNDSNFDTPSLTALASGLKHNTTMKQLAVEKYFLDMSKDHFQVLFDAVDSSAVEMLWLHSCPDYKWWFNKCTLSRKGVGIKWYGYYYDLFNKW